MRSFVRNKILSQAGESIGETLVALLIAALALVMLAGAVSASFGLIQKSRTKVNDYYSQTESLVNRTSSSTNDTISIADITYKDDNDNKVSGLSYEVYCYKNTEFNSIPVIGYKKVSKVE